MGKDFIPESDGGLLGWSSRFAECIVAEAASLGLTQQEADDFAALQLDFKTKYFATATRATRTVSNVTAKNASRDAMKLSARLLAKKIAGTASVSASQRVSLGLNVRKPAVAIPVPPSRPNVFVVGPAHGFRVNLQLRDSEVDRRARPPGVAGAHLFTFVGPRPPDDVGEWRFAGAFPRTEFEFRFPLDTAPFAQVWFAAAWVNPRGQRGAMGTPVSTNLGTWLVRAA